MSVLPQITAANRRAAESARRSPFRHMSMADVAVWRDALRSGQLPTDDWDYDVKVGAKAGVPLDAGPVDKAMWETLTRKRIDAVGVTRDEVWIVEVKPVASMSALGQVLTYAWHWAREHGDKKAVRPVIVAGRIDVDVEPVAALYGVTLIATGRDDDASLAAVLPP